MSANLAMVASTTAKPMKQFFYCRSCQLDRPIEQLGKIIKPSNSKRCTSCCDKADAQRKLIAKGLAA